ncbi:unnamed protein product [Adineta steineri]|uniref:Uncharacterized protein n=1 Tax=Adineta steineri TaxID=433720 RepID=A0A814LCH5_9BILA|nr:unnamed protein product [Adineta steineri]
MNSFSPYHSTPTDVFLKRFRSWKRQYLHIIIYTSLFWIFVDVFFIMLFSDCTKEIILPYKKTLTACVRLLEAGVHPDALAQIIQVLRTETRPTKL